MVQDLICDWRGWSRIERVIVTLAAGLSVVVVVLGVI
jgi:hypothetical protein